MALNLNPDDPAEVHRNRGWSHLFASSFELALRDFDAVLRLDPADADGHAGRASARVRKGQIHQALADTEESLKPAEPSSRLLYVAAQTYACAAARAAEVARRDWPGSRDSLSYEARAADLLGQALERTPADRRPAFWRDVIARDALLRPLLHNPSILKQLKWNERAPSEESRR